MLYPFAKQKEALGVAIVPKTSVEPRAVGDLIGQYNAKHTLIHQPKGNLLLSQLHRHILWMRPNQMVLAYKSMVKMEAIVTLPMVLAVTHPITCAQPIHPSVVEVNDVHLIGAQKPFIGHNSIHMAHMGVDHHLGNFDSKSRLELSRVGAFG